MRLNPSLGREEHRDRRVPQFIMQSAEHTSVRFSEETLSQGIKNGERVRKDVQFSTWISPLHIHVNIYTHICKHTCMHYTHTDTHTQRIFHIFIQSIQQHY